MNYNIEFQIAGLIVLVVLACVFFSKKRWKSLQNRIFTALLIVTIVEIILDIASVITITERETFPRLNAFLSKTYLLAMISYIYTVALYTLSNTIPKAPTPKLIRSKKIEAVVLGLFVIASFAVIIFNPLLYSGEGRKIFSYGIPSSVVYIFSPLAVCYVFFQLLKNAKIIPATKQISMYFFCAMEGIVALVQMNNRELLIVGFGSVIVVLIIYFTLENPDMSLIEKLNEANTKSRKLLLNILPEAIADKLENEYKPFTETYDEVSVIFMDIVGFSKMSSEIGAEKTVQLLNAFFSEIDSLIGNFRIEKIKTMGDAYMAAAGLPEHYEGTSTEAIEFALAVKKLLISFNLKRKTCIELRIGINTGKVVAGVIGQKKFIYDLWGETVNLASRLESYGDARHICVSEKTALLAKKKFSFTKREPLDIKGFGKTVSYFVKA